MKAIVNLHPVLTQELFQKIGYSSTDYSFEYDLPYRSVPLFAESITGKEHIQTQFLLRDDLNVWNSEIHNLRFKREIVIQNPAHLFGVSGIAGQSAEIGVAVVWASKPSSQRGIFVGESFDIHTTKREFTVSGEFPAGLLRERFQLTTILYLKKQGTFNEEERHLAQKPGVLLGDLGTTIFHLSGKGSIFPIFSYKENGPLWRVECNWGDPRTDPFDDENVRIILNENHPDYRFLESTDRKKLSPLMKEIIASAIQIIIEKAASEVPLQDIMEGTDVERGSVCMAIQYFIQTFELDTSSSENLAFSLRTYLDRKMGGFL
jgi:hypothetical protein